MTTNLVLSDTVVPLFTSCGFWQIEAATTLIKIAPVIAQCSKELSTSSIEATEKGTLALQYTNDVATVLQGFKRDGSGSDSGNGGMMNLKTFHQIRELIEEKKTRKALTLVKEMDDIAITMTTKAKQMSQTLMESIEQIVPENVREDNVLLLVVSDKKNEGHQKERGEERGGGCYGSDENVVEDDDGDDSIKNFRVDVDEYEEAITLMELLDHTDSDIQDIQTNTRSMENNVDLFTASDKGRNAFTNVAMKENVAIQIFHEIKSISDTIIADTTTLAVVDGGGLFSSPSNNNNSSSGNIDCSSLLCNFFVSTASSIDAMFKAFKLSKLIQRAILSIRKLLSAFITFISTSWNKFQYFFQQFDAGKKIQRLLFTNTKIFQNYHLPFGSNNGNGGSRGGVG